MAGLLYLPRLFVYHADTPLAKGDYDPGDDHQLYLRDLDVGIGPRTVD